MFYKSKLQCHYHAKTILASTVWNSCLSTGLLFLFSSVSQPKSRRKKLFIIRKKNSQKNCCSISKRWKIVLNVLTENKIHKQMESLWITTKFGEMLQPKNVHQLLRNQNSGAPCGTFSSTTTVTAKVYSKWGPKRNIY